MAAGDRIQHLDIARGIAIVLVVLGHAKSPFDKVLYLFHVGLFFFLSGICYNYSRHRDKPLHFVRARIRALYLPFLGYSIVFLALHNIFVLIGFYSSEANYTQKPVAMYLPQDFLDAFLRILAGSTPEDLIGGFWFLPALLATEIIFVLIGLLSFQPRLWTAQSCEVGRLMAIFLVFLIGDQLIRLGQGVPIIDLHSLVLLPIFYAGYLYGRNQDRFDFHPIVGLVGIAFLYMNTLRYEKIIHSLNYPNPITLLSSVLVGSLSIISFAKLAVRFPSMGRFIAYAGRNTLPILGLHFLAFKVVHLVIVSITAEPHWKVGTLGAIRGDHLLWVLYTTVGVLLPLGCRRLLDGLTLRSSQTNSRISAA